jgi:hypothetical protein
MPKPKRPPSPEISLPKLPASSKESDNGILGLTPWAVLQAAVKAVPALRYALAVLGIVSAIAIIKGFGIDFRVAVFGTIIMVVLMTALVVFAALTKLKSLQVRSAALVLMWSFLGLAILSAVLLFTSAFFSYPMPLAQLLGLAHNGIDNNSALDDNAYKFEVFSHHRHLDLSEWQFVPDGKTTEMLSPALWTERLKLRRLREDAKSLCIRHASTGVPSPEFSSDTHHVNISETTERPLEGSRPKLRIFDVCLDVSGEPVGGWFGLTLVSKYWNAFNNPETAWAAMPIVNPTKLAVFEIHFPKDKPVKTWERREGSRDRSSSELITDNAIEITGRRMLRWKVENPQRNWVYKFVWEW